MIILCHVDDNWTCGDPEVIEATLKELPSHGFPITVERNTKDYLGCEVAFSKDRKKAWVGQPHIIKKLREMFGEEVKSLQRYRTGGIPGLA